MLGIILCVEPIVFRKNPLEAISSYWAVSFGTAALIVGAILVARRRIAERLPSFEVLDDVMYKSIAIGFAFFTIATILGAFWAAEAWGGYWSWDPKETWALIVWLNYAAWLHMRLMKGLRGALSAWWALTGLVVTTFAFLGVNMFLSGLHSYGTLSAAQTPQLEAAAADPPLQQQGIDAVQLDERQQLRGGLPDFEAFPPRLCQSLTLQQTASCRGVELLEAAGVDDDVVAWLPLQRLRQHAQCVASLLVVSVAGRSNIGSAFAPPGGGRLLRSANFAIRPSTPLVPISWAKLFDRFHQPYTEDVAS